MISNEELSALVAEKVMGLHLLKEDRSRCVAALNKRGTAAGMQCQWVPSFATNAGLALEAALEAMGGLGIDIVPQSKGGACVFWTGRALPRRQRLQTEQGAYGSTIARALCFVALRASGVDVSDDSEDDR